ncbi:hypothetical protein TL16_g12229 [Triparma laevis f. inornata]|uniref:Uncharacterized protein n=1 Tax=Triparma laevis f. inornata TaxID=1714386 RepID=A0A9W7BT96_9STRA|nr:hypothetical protein TL16_g12229 [Triparma laevis f. inornata]
MDFAPIAAPQPPSISPLTETQPTPTPSTPNPPPPRERKAPGHFQEYASIDDPEVRLQSSKAKGAGNEAINKPDAKTKPPDSPTVQKKRAREETTVDPVSKSTQPSVDVPPPTNTTVASSSPSPALSPTQLHNLKPVPALPVPPPKPQPDVDAVPSGPPPEKTPSHIMKLLHEFIDSYSNGDSANLLSGWTTKVISRGGKMTGKRWDAVYYDPSGVRYTSKVKVAIALGFPAEDTRKSKKKEKEKEPTPPSTLPHSAPQPPLLPHSLPQSPSPKPNPKLTLNLQPKDNPSKPSTKPNPKPPTSSVPITLQTVTEELDAELGSLSPPEEYEDGFDFGPRPKKRVRGPRKEKERENNDDLLMDDAFPVEEEEGEEEEVEEEFMEEVKPTSPTTTTTTFTTTAAAEDKGLDKGPDNDLEEGSEDATVTSSGSHPSNIKRNSMPCNLCEACVKPNCGKCRCCSDMICFGGTGKSRQRCLERRCLNKRVLNGQPGSTAPRAPRPPKAPPGPRIPGLLTTSGLLPAPGFPEGWKYTVSFRDLQGRPRNDRYWYSPDGGPKYRSFSQIESKNPGIVIDRDLFMLENKLQIEKLKAQAVIDDIEVAKQRAEMGLDVPSTKDDEEYAGEDGEKVARPLFSVSRSGGPVKQRAQPSRSQKVTKAESKKLLAEIEEQERLERLATPPVWPTPSITGDVLRDRPMVFESLDEGLRKVVEYGTVDVDKEGENYFFKYDEDIFGNTCKEPVKITEQDAWVGVLACERKVGITTGALATWIGRRRQKESEVKDFSVSMTSTELYKVLEEQKATNPVPEKNAWVAPTICSDETGFKSTTKGSFQIVVRGHVLRFERRRDGRNIEKVFVRCVKKILVPDKVEVVSSKSRSRKVDEWDEDDEDDEDGYYSDEYAGTVSYGGFHDIKKEKVKPFFLPDEDFIDLGPIDTVVKRSAKTLFFLRDFIFRQGDVDRAFSCPVDKKYLYECSLTGEEENMNTSNTAAPSAMDEGGLEGKKPTEEEAWKAAEEAEMRRRPLFLAMREPDTDLPANYKELKEIETLRAPTKPREAFIAFKQKRYLRIIHELKQADLKDRKTPEEAKKDYLENLSSFVNNIPGTGWHKEIRPRTGSAVQDFIYYAPDGTLLKNTADVNAYWEADVKRANDLWEDFGIWQESFSFVKVLPGELHKYPRLHISVGAAESKKDKDGNLKEYEVEAMSMLMKKWKELSDEERDAFEVKAKEDLERFGRESSVYRRWQNVLKIAEAGGEQLRGAKRQALKPF